jgi:hypothetical protein
VQINLNLTKLSSAELESIAYLNITAEEVFSYLNDEIEVRRFVDTLNSFSDGIDVAAVLRLKLCQYTPDVKRESIDRKVRDWLSGKHEPAEREDYIKICFALGLSEQKAKEFLSMTTDGTFHLRNPKELVFVYALRTGGDYPDAIEMFESLKHLQPLKEKGVFVLTKPIADAFENVFDAQSFYEFYDEHYDSLGELHNTAYVHFQNFLDILIAPKTPLYAETEYAYTIENVVNEYLRMNVPLDRQTAKYSILQKTIKKFWPNTTNILKMKNRTEDVTRRILLLLYLITEGAVIDVSEDYSFDEDLTDMERFEEHYWRLNSMLNDCGMAQLDPRNIFDWLVLYSMKSSDDYPMSDRFRGILDIIFD